jgi:NitT/TauT family transport system substrate-binding protein
MPYSQPAPTGLTFFGKFISFILIVGLIGLGAWIFMRPAVPTVPSPTPGSSGTGVSSPGTPAPKDTAPIDLVAAQAGAPSLPPALPYVVKDNTLDIELSEYAGYAGLIAANNGLEPTEDSFFFRKHGVKLRIKISEEESWGALNSGKMAASATTADVLAVYGKSLSVVVPVQIGFSRGADALVVQRDIKRINALKGRTVVAAQFTEAEFFLRWLAQETGIPVKVIDDLNAAPDPNAINLVFAQDAFTAGDVFAKELERPSPRLAGCVTWEPKTGEVVSGSGGKANILISNRNVLIIADVLIVNRGFADQNPKLVAALAEGVLEGNRLINASDPKALAAAAKAFKWDAAQLKSELAKVHLSNGPENVAFFSGAIDMAGSFGSIYQSAVFAYGRQYVPDPAPVERFLALTHLQSLEKSGAFVGQSIAIAPIRAAAGSTVETDPVLSKDIRFLFQPNSAILEADRAENTQNLEAIMKLMRVSPGSTILLRGHVDDTLVPEFKARGGDAFVRQMALKAVELSKNRAAEIRRLLIEKYKAEPARIEMVGRGWEEPVGTTSDEKRRVEVQWFTVE